MALIFDTLSYANTLKEAGEKEEIAEAHALAVRDYVMNEIVSREDLAQALDVQTLRLTVRFGVMLGGAVALMLSVLGTIIKLS